MKVSNLKFSLNFQTGFKKKECKHLNAVIYIYILSDVLQSRLAFEDTSNFETHFHKYLSEH